MSAKAHVSHTYEFIAMQVFHIFRGDIMEATLWVYARAFGHVHAFYIRENVLTLQSHCQLMHQLVY